MVLFARGAELVVSARGAGLSLPAHGAGLVLARGAGLVIFARGAGLVISARGAGLVVSLSITVKSRDFAVGWDAALDVLRTDLLSVAQALDGELVALARAKASDDVLQIHTGHYRDSILGRVTQTGDRIEATVFSTAPQAGILEFGGRTSAHDILPDAAEALRFEGGAGAVYAAIIHDPGATIAPHPVMRAAFDEMRDTIRTRLTAVADGFDR